MMRSQPYLCLICMLCVYCFSFEWQGDWSDSSKLWTDDLRREVNFNLDSIDDDGTFWMSFIDLCRYFYSINICMASSHNEKKWIEQRRRSCFVFNDRYTDNSQALPPQDSENMLKPPMYVLTVKDHSKVFVSVHQQDMRDLNAPPYVDIGVTVLKLSQDYSFELVGSSGVVVERQAQAEMSLSPGNYIIVPITTMCKYNQYRAEAGSFYCNPAAKAVGARQNIVPLVTKSGTKLTDIALSAFTEVFSRLDEDLDGVEFFFLELYL